jgi:hypothetical protein
MPFDADDLAAFNDTDMPGYALALVGGVEVAGRFRKRYAAALGMAGDRPSFVAPSADLAAAVHGTAVVIDGTAYTVAEVQVAAEGMPNHTCLILEDA